MTFDIDAALAKLDKNIADLTRRVEEVRVQLIEQGLIPQEGLEPYEAGK